MLTTPEDNSAILAALSKTRASLAVEALERAYNKCRPAVIDAAGEAGCFHVRIIDPAFEFLPYCERELLVKGALREQLADKKVPDFAELVTLHLITPEEPLLQVVDRYGDADSALIASQLALSYEHYGWRANSLDKMSSGATARLLLAFGNLWLMCRDLCYCAAIIVRKLWL